MEKEGEEMGRARLRIDWQERKGRGWIEKDKE